MGGTTVIRNVERRLRGSPLSLLPVEFFVDVAEVRVGDVCVDLRRVDRGVTEELLDRADVGAII